MELEKNPKCTFCDGSAGQIGFCCFPYGSGNVGCPAELRETLRNNGYISGYYCVHSIGEDVLINENFIMQISEGKK